MPGIQVYYIQITKIFFGGDLLHQSRVDLCQRKGKVSFAYHSLNEFLRGKVKGTNILMRRIAQKVCSIKSGPFLNIIKFLMREGCLMNLMELRLQQILQENHTDFIDSLRLSGIDVKRGGWSADAVDQNAQAGALSLIQFVSQENISDRCRDAFLRTIAGNLDGEERTFVMAWIYAAYEWAGRFPPYAIIQHMVDPALFCKYCVSLQKYLHMYLQGYFSRTVNIV